MGVEMRMANLLKQDIKSFNLNGSSIKCKPKFLSNILIAYPVVENDSSLDRKNNLCSQGGKILAVLIQWAPLAKELMT